MSETLAAAPRLTLRDRFANGFNWIFWFLRPKDPPGQTPSWRRRLTFTRLGRWYCGLTVGIGLAAINTGNNLLFLVLGVLLSSIIVSGILSENALREVRLQRQLPDDASVGTPALVGLVVRNEKKRAPSFALEVREADGEIQGSAFLLALLAKQEAQTAYRFTPTRRGRHRLVRLEIATRSPFGLFEKARPLDAIAELIVFPRKVEPPALSPRSAGSEGEKPQQRVGMGLEVHGLREHRPGEDARAIHWRSSARAGKLLAVEREEERRKRLCVVCDARGLSGEALERHLELGAALFVRALEEGSEVALALPGRTLPAGSGAAQQRAGLMLLALYNENIINPQPEPPPQIALLIAPRGA